MSDTFVDILRRRARETPDALAFRHLVDGSVDGAVRTWSYGELDREAARVATALIEDPTLGPDAHGPPRVLLLFDQELAFLAAFFGCLYAGAIAVPTSTPDPTRLQRTLARLGHIARDSGATIGLTTSTIRRFVAQLARGVPGLAAVRWVAVDELVGEGGLERQPGVRAEDIAFLQYTSGSTGDPKGVIVSHRNLIENQVQIATAVEHRVTHVVSWLPMFHDMGLIGATLHPVFNGGVCTFMSPLSFLQRPLSWLRALSHFRGDTAASPNFGFELLVRRARPEDVAALDLSAWHTALSGAEPVRAATLERFAETFAPAGFAAEALFPAYGLAEATLLVSGARRGRAPRIDVVDPKALEAGRAEPAEYGARQVSCGVVEAPLEVAIVREGRRGPEGEVGEVWVRGPSIASGYWHRSEDTARVFAATLEDGGGPFLRTGDLGFIRDGELFVTGRAKDLIIVRGANHYPQDIEHTVEGGHPIVRQGCSAAFGFEHEGEEKVVVVADIDRRKGPASVAEVARAVRGAVFELHGLKLHEVVLVEPQTVPKTSSGKIQRQEARRAWHARTLKEVVDGQGA